LLEVADRDAHAMIQAQRRQTEMLARALLERETLTRDEVLELLDVAELPVLKTADLAAA
jgi:ATP-dependent Zn protease